MVQSLASRLRGSDERIYQTAGYPRMTRASILRSRTAPKSSPSKFAKGVEVVLPHLFEPQVPAADRRSSLFNLKKKPGYYNAEAKAALLRREKTGPHDELFVDFSGTEAHAELLAAGRKLAEGRWAWQATVDGNELAATGAWSEVCWHREDACDYLEIELALTGGWRIERQMLLARQARFLYLADALLGPDSEPHDIAYEQSLPLANEVTLRLANETREATLDQAARARATVVPLSLGEWRAELAAGSLKGDEHALRLHCATKGRRHYAPLWIDLDPRRLAKPLTWRRLSVGENLAICPRDVASGFRVQAGKEQWVIYRSLTEFGNRSILGHNTAYSFVCGRLKSDGNLDPILEIE